VSLRKASDGFVVSWGSALVRTRHYTELLFPPVSILSVPFFVCQRNLLADALNDGDFVPDGAGADW
jgi:hypothetical protein